MVLNWNTVQCLSHSYIRQSSLHAELKQEGDRAEHADIFWEGSTLTPEQLGVFKRDCSLPPTMACPHFTCSFQRHTHMWLSAQRGKRACGNRRKWRQWHKSRHAGTPTAIRDNTLSVLHIGATYITDCCELCNAPPLLIFKCIPLWSNYNWAFICFVPCLWGIDGLWREFSGSETKVSKAERTFPPHRYVAQEYRLDRSD